RGPDGPDERYADFQFARETPTPQTFQVLREKFDEILLRHSEKSGARVLEEHRLTDAAFDSDGVTLTVAHNGTVAPVRVGVVIDAAGRAGVLVKRFGRHEPDPLLLNIAVHAQYEGIPRASGRRGGDIRMYTRPDMGWLWFIPLSDTVISGGAVIPQVIHRRDSKATPGENLAHSLGITPTALPLLQKARRVSPFRYACASRRRLFLSGLLHRGRPLGRGRRRSGIPGPGVLHRRDARHAGRPRDCRGHRRGPARRRSVGAGLRPLRAGRPQALSPFPPV